MGAWTQDLYAPTYDGAPSDGTAREGAKGSIRVERGGSFFRFGGFSQAAARNPHDHSVVSIDIGFRPARSGPLIIQEAATRKIDISADQADCDQAVGFRPSERKTGVTTKLMVSRKDLLGKWRTTSTGSAAILTTTLKSDGRYSSVYCGREGRFSRAEGTWSLRQGAIVWLHGDGSGPEDVNSIIEFESDRFTIKEMSGSLTTLERLQ